MYLIINFNVVTFYSEIHGGEVMRINMCAAIIVMQSVFLIGAHVEAQQVFTHSQVLLFKMIANTICSVLHGWSRGQKN